jgi:uncharacterized protein DUF2188
MMTSRHDVHVNAKRVQRWKVTQGGRTLSYHRTQEAAVAAARRAARRSRVDLVTHGCNGRIRSKDSFGHESAAHDTER